MLAVRAWTGDLRFLLHRAARVARVVMPHAHARLGEQPDISVAQLGTLTLLAAIGVVLRFLNSAVERFGAQES
jgi:hypothetical protein